MKETFYAVRKGFTPGIYRTWDECKAQVNKFSGAEFKKFTSRKDAENFINTEAANNVDISNVVDSSLPFAYVDGSVGDFENKKFTVYSYGVIIRDENQIIHEYKSGMYDDYLNRYNNDKNRIKELSKMRNVIGELNSAITAMTLMKERGIKEFNLFYDYEGIYKFAKRIYNNNFDIIEEYVKFYENLVSEGFKVNFYHTYSHTGIHYNEAVDKLAGEALVEQYKKICGDKELIEFLRR